MEHLRIGPRQIKPRPHIAQVELHPRRFGRRIEEARLLQPRLIMGRQRVDLGMAGHFALVHRLRRLHPAPRRAPPLIGREQHALRKIDRREIGIDRHRNQRIGPRHILILQPGALRAEQHSAALPRCHPPRRIGHRLIGRKHWFGQIACPRGRGIDIGAILDRGGGAVVVQSGIQHPPRATGQRHGPLIGPAIARRNHAHPGEAEIPHGAGGSADILAHLRADQDEGGAVAGGILHGAEQ